MMEVKTVKRVYTIEMANKLVKISIAAGSHGHAAERACIKKEMCIMEAVAVITGQPFTDHPVCVSEAILYEMQKLNDALPNANVRGRLKTVVPQLIGTAPVVENTYAGGRIVELTDKKNPRYKQAETLRHYMIEAFIEKHGTNSDDGCGGTYVEEEEISDLKVTLKRKLEFIVELANVAHFNEPEQAAA